LKSEEVYKLRNKFLMIGLINMLSEILKTSDFNLKEMENAENTQTARANSRKFVYRIR